MRPNEQRIDGLPIWIVGYVEKLTIGNDQFILVPKKYVDHVISSASMMFPVCLYVVSKSNVPGFMKVSRQILPYHYWHSRTSLDRCYVDSIDAGVIWYYVNTEDNRILTSSTIKDFLHFWMPDQQK